MPRAAILAATLALLATPAAALPPCPEDFSVVWTGCTGSFTLSNGENFVGEFRDGTANGQGTYTFPNGAVHVGEFRDDKAHGRSTMYAPYGRILQQGVWIDGRFAYPF